MPSLMYVGNTWKEMDPNTRANAVLDIRLMKNSFLVAC